MTALLDLTPRAAGARTVEPVVVFDQVDQAVSAQDRCPISCFCHGNSDSCTATGRTLAE